MGEFELIVGLLTIVVVLATIAQRLAMPYPMLLLVLGIVLALIPGLDPIEMEPHLALVLFLPPVLFEAAFFTSWRDFKRNSASIGGLAIGGVLLTTVLVALAAHELFDGMSWAMAFALGAIVSPPDAVAASTIFRRLGVPHRVTTILEGESLVNDASALVAFRLAVAAILTGSFSMADAGIQFLVVSVGGVAIGIATGKLITVAIGWIDDTNLEIAATLVVPFLIYILAEEVHVSGVLAVVTAGLIFGRTSSRALSSASRVGGIATWQSGLILINGTAFILIGLQLRHIIEDFHGSELWNLIGSALVISLVVVVARFLWLVPFSLLRRGFLSGKQCEVPSAPIASSFIIGWSGLRGIVSLASALSLPLVDDDGVAVAYRNEVLVVTFVVICVTLLGQGLPLPWLLRKLDLQDDGEVEAEVRLANTIALRAMVDRLNDIEGSGEYPDDHVGEMRERFQHMLDALSPDEDHAHLDEAHIADTRRLRQDVIEHARRAMLDARNRGEIGDAARVSVEANLDIELLRFTA